MTDRKNWQAKVYQSDETYDTDKWIRLTRRIYRRDNYTCRLCSQKFPEYDIGAHHLTPRAVGGQDEEWNLITLCHECHNHVESLGFKTAEEFYRYRRVEYAGGEDFSPDDVNPYALVEKLPWQMFVYGGLRPRWIVRADSKVVASPST
jgi:hypothetical protein